MSRSQQIYYLDKKQFKKQAEVQKLLDLGFEEDFSPMNNWTTHFLHRKYASPGESEMCYKQIHLMSGHPDDDPWIVSLTDYCNLGSLGIENDFIEDMFGPVSIDEVITFHNLLNKPYELQQ